MDHQDWETVTFRKKTSDEKAAVHLQQMRVSQRATPLAENPDQFSHAKMSKAMAQQIAKGRMARKLSQKALAAKLSVPLKTIQAYEAGKAIPKGSHINLLNRALGIRILRDDKHGGGGAGGGGAGKK